MKKFFNSGIGFFRTITFLEGMSLLILLFIAMPMKYAFNQPDLVRIVGSAHGLLFIIYIYLAFRMSIAYEWSLIKTLLIMGASFVPFATFYVDAKILKELHQQVA